jgi:hypothetical protein
VLQLYLVLQARWAMGASLVGGLIHVLSYFTVLSNTFAAAVLSAHAWPRDTRPSRWCRLPPVAGCAVISLLLVGIAYNLLLRQFWHPQGAQWLANEVLHDLMPPAMLAFWCWCVPKGRLRPAHVALWALYPLGWYGFTLMRGWSIGVWPYPFLDATDLGFARAFVNALGLLAAFCLAGLVLVSVDCRLARRRRLHGASSRQP